MKKLNISIMIAVLLTVLFSLTAITVLASDDPITINSIEIEAPQPVAGATADLTSVKIKSANKDEELSDSLGFISKNLYWAKVPSLDPSDWGNDWEKFTGTFEGGNFYSLHFALQSDLPLAESCEITVTDPDGEVWWSGNIASEDAKYVSVDAVIELEAFVINSIELDTRLPLYVELPTIKSVNGNEEYKDYVTLSTIFESAWYVAEDPGTAIDDPNSLHWDKIEGSIDEEEYPWLTLQMHFTSQGGATFAENCEVTLNLFEREIASTELKSESALNYADICFVPIVFDPNDVSGFPLCDYVVFGEDLVIDFVANPFPKPGFIGVAFTPDATEGEMQLTIPNVRQSYILYGCWGEVSTTITSIEITSTVEIDPVIGEFPETNPGNFTVTKVNGDTSLIYEMEDIDLYWYFSDINDPKSYNWLYNPGDKEFIGGYYYKFNIDFYLDEWSDYIFGEDVEVTLITPTKTINSVYSRTSDDYAEVYWTFDNKTEGEPLKYIGDTTVSISGFEPGAIVSDVDIIIQGEGAKFDKLYGTTYFFYNYTDDETLEWDDTFEEGKCYFLYFDLYSQPGYTVADFTLKYLNVTMNGFTPSYADYDFDAGDEYATIEFILPLFEETNKVSAPTISLDGYEIGNRFDDLFLEFSGNGLSVDTTYGMGYCAGDGNIWFIDGPFGEVDKVIEKDEKYILSIMMQVTEGYGIGGITKDMFVLNGITPYTLALNYEFDCLCIIVDYELPVLHEEEAGWHYDTTHHWGECECGERINIEAHECTDGTGKCDMCGYEISDPIYIYNGFDLTMKGFELGKPVSGITVTPQSGAHYTVESVSVYNFTKSEYCDPTHVLAVGNVYRIDVKLKADYGYVLLISKTPIGAYDVTLNGYTTIARSSTDPNQYEFFMYFSEATTPYPKGEITINGYELDAFAGDITLTLPDGYTLIGNYEIGYVLLDGEGPAEEIDNSTGYWLAINISVNPAYDPMSLSKKNLTLFGLNADIFAYNPIQNCYTMAFYLPDAPSASDKDVDKLEFTLDGFKIGTSTDDITFTPNGGTGYKVDSGMFIYNDGSYDIYIGEIEAGQKYYYMMSITAKEGYTLTSLRRENVTLNGKTPEEFFYEDGEFLFLVFELDTTPGTTPEPGTNPGTDDPADGKDGLGAGAIVAIVLGSVAVAGIGGFAVFWFVIKKNSFGALIEAIGSFFKKIFSIFKKK